jgi:hypothetical protein
MGVYFVIRESKRKMGGNKAVYFYSHLAKQGNCW